MDPETFQEARMKAQTMNVSLPPELANYVREKVESGMYTSASEVVREGLRLLASSENGADEVDRGAIQQVIDGFEKLSVGKTLGPDLSIDELIDEGRS